MSRRGFTLVEAVLAIALLGLVAATLGAILGATTRVQQQLPQTAELEATADAIERRLREDMRLAVGVADIRAGVLELLTQYLADSDDGVEHVRWELEGTDLYRTVDGSKRLFARGVSTFTPDAGGWAIEDAFEGSTADGTLWYGPYAGSVSGGLLHASGVVRFMKLYVDGVASRGSFSRREFELEVRFQPTTAIAAWGFTVFDLGTWLEGFQVFFDGEKQIWAGYFDGTSSLLTALKKVGTYEINRWYTLRAVRGPEWISFWIDEGSGLRKVYSISSSIVDSATLNLLAGSVKPEGRWDHVRLRTSLGMTMRLILAGGGRTVERLIRGRVKHE